MYMSSGRPRHEGGINKIETLPTKDEKEEKPSKDEMPEFMTAAMREKISRTVLRKEHEEKVKSMLEASETACDDTHKFNPSRFDMENAMRINLKIVFYSNPVGFCVRIHLG